VQLFDIVFGHLARVLAHDDHGEDLIFGDIVLVHDSNDLAGMHHRNAVCEVEHVVDVVADQEDPYALRRQTLAILTILIEKGYPLPLSELIGRAQGALNGKISVPPDENHQVILDYFKGRFSGLMTGCGHRYDTVDAVLGARFDDPLDAKARVEALSAFRQEPLFEPFTVVCKRAMNIIKESFGTHVETSLLTEKVERQLHEATGSLEALIPDLMTGRKYGDALHAIASLRDPIDAFFEGVMVMDKDPRVRENRLALLSRVAALVAPTADFSRIVVD